MKLKAFISAWVSPADGQIYIDASRYAAQTPYHFDIVEMEFDVPDAAIKKSEAIKADTSDIEKQIAELQTLLDALRASQ